MYHSNKVLLVKTNVWVICKFSFHLAQCGTSEFGRSYLEKNSVCVCDKSEEYICSLGLPQQTDSRNTLTGR